MSLTQAQLYDKTNPELRQICTNMGITGMGKARKDDIVSAIISEQRKMKRREANAKKKAAKAAPKTVSKSIAASTDKDTVRAMQGSFTSVLQAPNARRGDKNTTTLRVSAGASSGEFPVVGKTVGAVSEFLREVLNVDALAQGIVNGQPVQPSYVLKEGDTLEYIKSAGSKG